MPCPEAAQTDGQGRLNFDRRNQLILNWPYQMRSGKGFRAYDDENGKGTVLKYGHTWTLTRIDDTKSLVTSPEVFDSEAEAKQHAQETLTDIFVVGKPDPLQSAAESHDECTHACQEASKTLVDQVRIAAQDDWRAAAWLLSFKDPDSFAKHVKSLLKDE